MPTGDVEETKKNDNTVTVLLSLVKGLCSYCVAIVKMLSLNGDIGASADHVSMTRSLRENASGRSTRVHTRSGTVLVSRQQSSLLVHVET